MNFEEWHSRKLAECRQKHQMALHSSLLKNKDCLEYGFLACQGIAQATVELSEQLARDLLDPESLGHAVTEEVRDRAREILGIKKVRG